MDFNVREQKFKITFVNNYCRERYQDLLDSVDDLADLPGEIDDISNDKSLLDKEKIAKYKDIKKSKRELVKATVEIRKDILVEILETNNYKYDSTWWLRKTSADDINTFVLDCLQKDLKGNSSKKK
ncbi:MAG: hypothetical protein PF693_11000 [Spirochaetia bacterium]|jgi:hypothetical protein|nr:hypothetical protein [Spirochaetia bacterium]